jgi:signal peptidase II
MPSSTCFRWLFLSLFIILFDQYTKWYAGGHLLLHTPYVVNRFFNWYLDFNHGAAWNFLGDQSGWQRWALSGFSATVSIFLLALLRNTSSEYKMTCASLALLLGGAVGNLIDRLYFGVVTDFIQWHIGTHYWPTFNIADSAVCVGAVLFIWGMKKDD